MQLSEPHHQFTTLLSLESLTSHIPSSSAPAAVSLGLHDIDDNIDTAPWGTYDDNDDDADVKSGYYTTLRAAANVCITRHCELQVVVVVVVVVAIVTLLFFL